MKIRVENKHFNIFVNSVLPVLLRHLKNKGRMSIGTHRVNPLLFILRKCHNPKLLDYWELTKLVKHHTLDIYLIYATT